MPIVRHQLPVDNTNHEIMSSTDGPVSAPSRRSQLLTTLRESSRKAQADFFQTQRYNIETFYNQPLAEISGSFGDIGTLLPILIALTQIGAISLSSTLVFSGLANILTGLAFGVPLPVQPMKAIAAVALAQGFSKSEIASAGIFVAAAIGFLSITGLIHWFTERIPIPVIKGIQVGTGLSLIISAGNLYPHFDRFGTNPLVLILAFLGLLASSTFRRVPYALLILLVGIISVISTDWLYPGWGEDFRPDFSTWHPHTFVPSPREFGKGTLEAGIGQLPLTTLNSVIAVAFLAQDILPNVRTPSTTSLGLSVMAINLVGCWFGAMPVCHGSGGLAAQYRFGARSGASIIFLGLLKLLLGLFASKVALAIFNGFPNVLLCVLVIAAGLELVGVGESLNTARSRDLSNLGEDGGKGGELTEEERKRRWAVMFMTVAGILAFKNDAVGFLAGVLCHWSFKAQDRLEERRGGEGRIRLGEGREGERNA
ncbi:hypothetical protein HO133_005740 [Letharia lupina]|uniref:Sulfate transporter n=1 Tax=Letharia lupina TaxID=560253 RepID=A0A8H6C7V5_9LECA|nr:uncharacterized protein HO133_005740 [Letharia lupina]KAF6218393.1 hypothetical protein HO133_005740 [Letharia lupina]